MAISLRALRSSILTSFDRHQHTFLTSRENESELAAFERMSDVLAPWLSGDDDRDGRGQLVLALLRQYQRSPHALWSNALFVLMYPTLAALRRRVVVPQTLAAERDGMIVDAFFGEVARLNLADLGALPVLCRATERTLFADIQRWRRATAAEVAFHEANTNDCVTPDLDLYVDLSRIANDVPTLRALSVSLRKQVDITHADVPESERVRLYERMKKQRTRARARLRQSFALAA